MSIEHLSDRFLAHVALAACRPSTARALMERLDAKLAAPEGKALSAEKRGDMLRVIHWLRICCGEAPEGSQPREAP